MIITSPPYWNMRNYGCSTEIVWDATPGCKHNFSKEIVKKHTGGGGNCLVASHRKGVYRFTTSSRFCVKCGAWKGQLGHEPDLYLYLKHLLDIFDELKRVLKEGGTCWVNISDRYGGNPTGMSWKRHDIVTSQQDPNRSYERMSSWHKCMLAIPERFAIGMIDRGWILRNKIVWHKTNPIPCPVPDRFSNTWEHLLFFSKSGKYYFDLDAVRVPHKQNRAQAERDFLRAIQDRHDVGGPEGKVISPYVLNHHKGKNPGDLWTISLRAFKDAHCAVFPEQLIEGPIRAGCPERVCRNGSATKDQPESCHKDSCQHQCKCSRGIVLDPFMGSGTTAVVAQKLGRDYMGFEPNPDYVRIARKRLRGKRRITRNAA